ncbi:MAG: DNA polymerase IV [Candidatus Omnitrophota bacterium]
MISRIIFHLDLDAFFASVEQRDNLSLRGKPVIVGADPKGGKGRGVVATCSYEARAFGIHSAMPISQAYKRCPQGVYVQPDGERYREASRQVFTIMEEFSPDVEPVSCDEAFLDMSGSCQHFGTPRQAAEELRGRIRERTGLTASVGIAPNKFVAKIASDYDKPDGCLEVTAQNILGFLHPLPIEKLWGVGPATANVLHRMGLLTIGDIARQDVRSLQQKLGVHGAHLYALANGIDERSVETDDEVKSVSHEETFDQDEADQRVIMDTLLHLSEKVSRRMRRYGLQGRTLTLKVRLPGFRTYSHAARFPERTNYADRIFKQARRIYVDHYSREEAVRLVGIRMTNFDDGYVQDDLFAADQHRQNETLHEVLDRIKDKFGDQAIRRAGS